MCIRDSQYRGVIGADILIEGNRVYRFGGGTGWDWIDVGATTLRYNDSIVELSFPRNWLGSHSIVKLAFFGNNQPFGGTTEDSYPNTGSFEYFFGSGSFGINSSASLSSLPNLERSAPNHEPSFNQTTTTNPVSGNTSSGGGSFFWLLLMSSLILIKQRTHIVVR